VQSTFNARKRPPIELKADVAGNTALRAADSFRLHWPEYSMDRCHPAMASRLAASAIPAKRCGSPVADGLGDGRDRDGHCSFAVGQAVRRTLQSRGHIHVSSIGESCVVGCGLLLRRATPRRCRGRGARLVCAARRADKAVHYAATLPGIYGDTIVFVAELSFHFS
jgi:hypothetical protein